MKKIISLFIFSALLFALSPQEIEKKIYTKIFHVLLPTKQTIYVWVEDKKDRSLFDTIPNVQTTDTPEKADILIVIHNEKVLTPKNCQKIILSENYRLIKKHQDCILGGFFWHKGRPNILFLAPNLKRFHIHLPKEMEEFVEDSL